MLVFKCVAVIPAGNFIALVLLGAWAESDRRGTLYSRRDLYQKADMFQGLKSHKHAYSTSIPDGFQLFVRQEPPSSQTLF